MYTRSILLFFRAVSPLHPGAGEGLGYIDRPIQRRSDNDHPKMEGSGIKGVLREAFSHRSAPGTPPPGEATWQNQTDAAFGPSDQDDSRKSAINIQDGRILLFPVSSPVGNTLYLTCPSILQQFKTENERQTGFPWEFETPAITDHSQAYCPKGEENQTICFHKKLMPHRLVLIPEPLAEGLAEKLATFLFPGIQNFYHAFYRDRIVVVHDDVFQFFVKYRTEVVTGNRIDPATGVVATGALFTHEYLPVGTVLYTWLETGPEKKDKGLSAEAIYTFMKEGLHQAPYLTLGGRTSVGKGEVALTSVESANRKTPPTP